MKGKWNRLLSLLLALVLALPAFGGTALAEEEEIFPENAIVEMPEEGLSLDEESGTGLTVMSAYGVEDAGTEATGVSGALDGEELALAASEDFEPDANAASAMWEEDTLSAGSGLSSATLTPSQTSISIKKGNTSTVTFSVANFTGFFYLEYVTNNKTAFSCEWGAWNSTTKIPLRITAKTPGSGTITVRLRAPNDNKIYATKTVSVTVPYAETGTLSLSATSASIVVGNTYTLNCTTKNTSGSVYLAYSNSSSTYATLTWGSWSGSTIPLKVKGSKPGSGTITIYLKSASTNATLDTKTFKYSISNKTSGTLTLNPTSISVAVNSSKSLNCTFSGYSGYYYLQYEYSNSSTASFSWGSWSGNTIPLTIKGKNKGTVTITIYAKNSAGSQLAKKSVTVTVTQATADPKVTVSSSTASLTSGGSKKITASYSNVSETIYLAYSTTNSSAYSCSWGSWSGSSIPLTITAKTVSSTQTGTVTIYLKRARDGATLASAKISVTVSPSGGGGGGGGEGSGGTLTFAQLAYPFANYGTTISLANCQRMFGNTQTARNIYYCYIGNGGCCSGFVSSSSILGVSGNGLNPSAFNGSKVSNLYKSNYSSSLKMYVSDFIESLQVAQVASTMGFSSGLSSLVSKVKSETAAGRPVQIGVRGMINGSNAGHALSAFGYTETSSAFKIKIYDCNFPSAARTLTISKSGSSYTSWSYPITDYVTWGTGKSGASISYATYQQALTTWNNRGSLKAPGFNMIITQADNFTLLDFDNHVMAKYQNGRLVQKADSVTEASWDGVLPNGAIQHSPHVLIVPADFYTVKNDAPGTRLNLSITDDLLSTRVETDAAEFGICADDASSIANATLTPEEGADFSIMIGSSRPGDAAETLLEGEGTGEPISMELSQGVLSISGEGVISLSRTDAETEYFITSAASEGGSISPSGTNSFTEGSDVLYTIEPDEGCVVQAVYVDGENKGPMLTYTFEDLAAPHVIEAVFARNINTCQIELSQSDVLYTGGEQLPAVTVTAPDGTLLVLNEDYEVFYENNVEPGEATVYVVGAQGSRWYGSAQVSFTISQGDFGFTQADFSPLTGKVTAAFQHTGKVKIIAALYDGDGAMVAAKTLQAADGTDTATLTFDTAVIPAQGRVKLFMVDSAFRPLCASTAVQFGY